MRFVFQRKIYLHIKIVPAYDGDYFFNLNEKLNASGL